MEPQQHKHMRTDHLLIALACILGSLAPAGTHAQKLKERMAERSAEVFDYPRLAAIYEDMANKGRASDTDLRKLALAYRRMNRLADAERTYARLMETGNARPEDLFQYAEQLRNNGRYPEAIEWYGNYLQQVPDDARAAFYVNDPGFFARMMRDTASATIRTLPINSPQADLGLGILDDLLLFSSARGEGPGGRRSYAWDEEPFLSLYTALLKGEHAEDPMVMRRDINSRYHDGTCSYDSLANRLYFTRNNFHYGVVQRSAQGNLNLGIYFSDIVEGAFGQKEWAPIVPFDHNKPDFNLGHPCVSHDGRRLYFVSDMPGGFGGTDIWFCDNLGNQWGAPQNMGPKVNSPGNEMFPWISADSVLYFASNGHPGLGGFDIFRSRLTAAGPGNVFNMGYPLNTRHNDHGLILIDDTTGFFVSNRPGGMGSDDIYGCTVRPQMIYIAGRVIDKATREPIENATILLKDANGEHVKRYQLETEPGGLFRIDAEYHQRYVLATTKSGYFQSEMPIVTDTDPLLDLLVELVKYDYAAEGTVFHGDTGEPLDSVMVSLLDGAGELLQPYPTGPDGKYQFALEPEKDYRIVAERDGFFKQSVRISTKGKPSAVIYSDFRLFPLEVGQIVKLEDIYYDFNKADIRPDAALELDKLVQTLMDNPTVKIELSSHTDCRGRDAYNMSLSERRAKSAVDYLVSRGIARDRLKSKGYGSSKPVADCVCRDCTEEQHQENRRTEFKVLDK